MRTKIYLCMFLFLYVYIFVCAIIDDLTHLHSDTLSDFAGVERSNGILKEIYRLGKSQHLHSELNSD